MRNNKKTKSLLASTKVATLIGCLLVVFLFLAVTSLLTPSSQNQTTIENMIQQKTTFSYMANVQQSEIYPEGGLIEPGNVIFEKVTKDIPTTIHTSIASEKEIEAQGTFQPILTIEAGEYWKKEIPLSDAQTFQIEGNESNVIDDTFSINIAEIQNLIKSVEEEIGVTPDSNYLVKVNPNVNGTIKYEGNEIPLNGGGELVFEYGYNKIQLVSEKVFIAEIPFETQTVVQNNYQLLGLEAPLLAVKIISTILSICLAAILFYLLKSIRVSNVEMVSEAQKIDKKNSGRLVTVTKKLDIVNKSFLELDSFKALVQVSDEKELPIFRYEHMNKEKVEYFIIDVDHIFCYKASNKIELETHITLGSDVSYG